MTNLSSSFSQKNSLVTDISSPKNYDCTENLSQFKLMSRNAVTLCYQWVDYKQPFVKRSTAANYLSIINSYLAPRFKDMNIDDIDRDCINGFCSELISRYKPKTVKDILRVLSQVLVYAKDLNYIEKIPHITFPKEPKNKIPVFSAEEVYILTEYLKKDIDRQKAGILLCLYTGMRLGEICGLKTLDIDKFNRTIMVRRTLQRISCGNGKTEFLLDSPKTENSVRDIPIPDILFSYIQQFADSADQSFFLTGEDRFTQPRTYQNRFKRMLMDCGIKQLSFHALRHTFATLSIESGVDAKTISELLGHASVNITLNRYVHSSIEQKKRNIELVFETVTACSNA